VSFFQNWSSRKKNFPFSKVGKNLKIEKFFDAFARSKNFNPLDAEEWYLVTEQDIINEGGKGILEFYKGSHVKALIELYPELCLRKNSFPHYFQEGGNWKDPEHRRKFFEEFAKSKQFHPLDAERWYSITKKEVINAGGGGVLEYYDGSHIKALIDVYPELVHRKPTMTSTLAWRASLFRQM